jgi:hypothetical protein
MAIVNAAEVQMTVELLEKRFAKEKIKCSFEISEKADRETY